MEIHRQRAGNNNRSNFFVYQADIVVKEKELCRLSTRYIDVVSWRRLQSPVSRALKSGASWILRLLLLQWRALNAVRLSENALVSLTIYPIEAARLHACRHLSAEEHALLMLFGRVRRARTESPFCHRVLDYLLERAERRKVLTQSNIDPALVCICHSFIDDSSTLPQHYWQSIQFPQVPLSCTQIQFIQVDGDDWLKRVGFAKNSQFTNRKYLFSTNRTLFMEMFSFYYSVPYRATSLVS
jgi:hypothetical protein